MKYDNRISLTQLTYPDYKYAFVGFLATDPARLNENTTAASFWDYVLQALYNPVLSLVKSSVLVLLLRIGGHQTRVRWTIYILNTVNMMLMVATFVVAIFQTFPIQAYWNPNIKAKYTINTGDFVSATSAITIVGDIIVLGIPLWLFLGLQMRPALKLGLIATFLLSGV